MALGLRRLGFTALATAVYSRLTTHALTNAYSFYNFVDKDTAMPYHVIGKPIGRESDSFTTRDTEAEENVIQIDSYFRDKTSGEGDKVCGDQQDNIMQAITSSPLSITGYNSPYTVFFEFSNILKDDTEPGDIVRHGTLRLRFEMAPS